jgi:uncharacterized protein (DUF885 family)
MCLSLRRWLVLSLPLPVVLILLWAGGALMAARHPDSRIPGGIPAGAGAADRTFYTIADRYLEDSFRLNPTLATSAGYHRYDGTLEDLSPAGLRAVADMARRYRDELAPIDAGALSASARIDLGLVRNDLDATLFSLDELKTYERDPQAYVNLLGNATLYLTLQPPDSPVWPERLAALRQRMKAIPRLLAAARQNLKNPSRVLTDLVIDTNAGNLAFFETTVPGLYDKAGADRKALEEENARAIAALKGFQTWLQEELRSRSTGDWRLGAGLWTKKLRLTLQSSMTPEEIVRRARESLDADRRRMLEVATPLHAAMYPDHRHDETGDERINVIVGEVLRRVCTHHSTRESLFGDVQKAAARIKAYIRERGLIGLPPDDDNFAIEPTPGFLDGVAVAFFNPPPVLEPELKKSFWISSVPRGGTPEKDRAAEESYLREYNLYALQGLTIHEAFPGHYVQFWYALRSPYATLYKKHLSSGTFAEGWAVLAERMMYESGYASGEPENLLIHLKQQLRAPLNAILDARLHTSAMSDEEADRFALDLMQRLGFQEETEAKGKLRRAKVSSTQLSTYFVGYLELSDMLAEARRREGAAFDLKRFNERLLNLGTIPPRDARALLAETPAPR